MAYQYFHPEAVEQALADPQEGGAQTGTTLPALGEGGAWWNRLLVEIDDRQIVQDVPETASQTTAIPTERDRMVQDTRRYLANIVSRPSNFGCTEPKEVQNLQAAYRTLMKTPVGLHTPNLLANSALQNEQISQSPIVVWDLLANSVPQNEQTSQIPVAVQDNYSSYSVPFPQSGNGLPIFVSQNLTMPQQLGNFPALPVQTILQSAPIVQDRPRSPGRLVKVGKHQTNGKEILLSSTGNRSYSTTS